MHSFIMTLSVSAVSSATGMICFAKAEAATLAEFFNIYILFGWIVYLARLPACVFAVESERRPSIPVHCIACRFFFMHIGPFSLAKTYYAGAIRMRSDSDRTVSGHPLAELTSNPVDRCFFRDEPLQSGASAGPLGRNWLLQRGGEAAACRQPRSLGQAAAVGRHCRAAG